MEFGCSECDYVSEFKHHITRHISRQNKCGPEPQVIKIPICIQCDYCEKTYKTKITLKRHLKTCKVKKKQTDKLITEKDREIAVLKAKLEAKPSVTNITNNINIQINSYRDTDFRKLNDKHFKHAVHRMVNMVPQLIEYTHFNKKTPENHNVYISNQKGKYAMVYNGQEWEIKDQNQTIDQLINDHEYELEQWVESDAAQPKELEKFRKYLDLKENKEGVEEELKEEVRRLLYNKRKIVK